MRKLRSSVFKQLAKDRYASKGLAVASNPEPMLSLLYLFSYSTKQSAPIKQLLRGKSSKVPFRSFIPPNTTAFSSGYQYSMNRLTYCLLLFYPIYH